MDKKDRVKGKWLPNLEGPIWITQEFSNNAYKIEETNPKRQTLRINGKYLKGYKPMLQEIQIVE